MKGTIFATRGGQIADGMRHRQRDLTLRTDHASPHSWDMSLRNVPIDMALNHSIIPIRPAGGAWSSVRDYARYVRLELAWGRLPDGSTFITEKNMLARRVPQVRVGADSWYVTSFSCRTPGSAA